MTFAEIEPVIRDFVDDTDSNLWDSNSIASAIDRTIKQIARTTRTYVDSVNIETPAHGHIAFSGLPTAPITSVTVQGVEVLLAPVAVATSIAALVSDIASKINPTLYIGSVSGNLTEVQITAGAGNGSNNNGLTLTSDATPSSIVSYRPFAFGADLCLLRLYSGQEIYPLDPRVLEIYNAFLRSTGRPIPIVDERWMDRNVSTWTTSNESGDPRYLITDYSPGKVRLYPRSDKVDLVDLKVVRSPLTKVLATTPTAEIDYPSFLSEEMLFTGVQAILFSKLRHGRQIDIQKANAFRLQFESEMDGAISDHINRTRA